MKIFKYYINNPDVDITMQDYSLISFEKTVTYERGGRKSKIEYKDEEGVNVVKTCTDILEEGVIVGVQHTHEWLDYDDTVLLSKNTLARIDSTSRGEILRKRRQRTIDHLNQLASGSPLEPVVDNIFDTFRNEVNKYIQIGSNDFLNAVMTSDMADLSYPTGFDHPAEDRKLTVREILAYEIS